MCDRKLMIDLLIADGHTKEEAERFDLYKVGAPCCVIYKSIEELNHVFEDVDIDAIRAGNWKDFSAVSFQGTEYFIEYLHHKSDYNHGAIDV